MKILSSVFKIIGILIAFIIIALIFVELEIDIGCIIFSMICGAISFVNHLKKWQALLISTLIVIINAYLTKSVYHINIISNPAIALFITNWAYNDMVKRTPKEKQISDDSNE